MEHLTAPLIARQIQALLDTRGISFAVWDPTGTVIDATNEVVSLFGFPNKASFLENKEQLSPLYQPDGKPSAEAFSKYLIDTLQGGTAAFDWLCKKYNGSHIDCHIKLYSGEYYGKKVIGAFVTKRFSTAVSITAESNNEINKLNAFHLESAPYMITTWDETFNIISVSRHVQEMFGISEEEYLKRVFELSPEYQPCGTLTKELHRVNMKRVFDEGIRLKTEWMCQTIDGAPLPTEITYARFNHNGSNIVAVYITDLRPVMEANKKTREMEELNNLFLNSAPMAINWVDENFVPIDCNSYTLEMFGFNNKKDYYTNLGRLHPEFQPCGTHSHIKLMRHLQNAMDTGYERFEWMYYHNNGEMILVDNVFVRLEREGKPMIVNYTIDMRGVAEATGKLLKAEREANELNRMYLEACPMFIEMWDDDENLIFVNEQVVAFLGLKNKWEFGARYSELSPEYQPCGTLSSVKKSALIKQCMEEGFVRFEWIHKKYNDSTPLPVEVIAVRLKYGGKDVIVAYNHDLRPIKAVMESEESNQAKTRFLARMSHEIRTPITAVLGISEMQLRGQAMPPHIEEAFIKIYDSSNMLLNIVNDILDFSKIESGKMQILEQEYDVASLVSDASSFHSIYLEQKNMPLELHLDPGLPLKLAGDALRIRQIINNLLSNAFKYTEAGKVTFSLHGEKTGEDKINLVVSIRDTGIGMREEQMAQIKNEYTRFHEQEKPYISGTGLGISIVYNLSKLMDAEFVLSSEVGKGTLATVSIPQRIVNPQPLGQEMAARLQNFEVSGWLVDNELDFEPVQLPHGKVLAVDDIDTNLYVIESMLEAFGLKITLCTSGEEAVEKIRNGNEYDIIFMDYMMPGMDGVQATRKIRDMGYDKPIVALTANALKGQAEMFTQNGFSGFMSKPVDIKILNSYLVRFVQAVKR